MNNTKLTKPLISLLGSILMCSLFLLVNGTKPSSKAIELSNTNKLENEKCAIQVIKPMEEKQFQLTIKKKEKSS